MLNYHCPGQENSWIFIFTRICRDNNIERLCTVQDPCLNVAFVHSYWPPGRNLGPHRILWSSQDTLHSRCPSCFMTPTPDSFCKAGHKKLALGCGNHSQSAITHEDDDLYIMKRVCDIFAFSVKMCHEYDVCQDAPKCYFFGLDRVSWFFLIFGWGYKPQNVPRRKLY